MSSNKGYKIIDEEEAVYVSVNGQLTFLWSHSMNRDCPEDCTWDRSISEVFEEGVATGIRIMTNV